MIIAVIFYTLISVGKISLFFCFVFFITSSLAHLWRKQERKEKNQRTKKTMMQIWFVIPSFNCIFFFYLVNIVCYFLWLVRMTVSGQNLWCCGLRWNFAVSVIPSCWRWFGFFYQCHFQWNDTFCYSWHFFQACQPSTSQLQIKDLQENQEITDLVS